MYTIDTYNTIKGTLRKIPFNSVDAAYQFLSQQIKHKDVQTYIERLRVGKKLDALNFAQSDSQLHRFYGDIDKQLPTLVEFTNILNQYGVYEHRFGTLDKMFHEGFGCLYFKVSSGIQNVSQRISSDETNKFNNRGIESRQILTDYYSRPNHD